MRPSQSAADASSAPGNDVTPAPDAPAAAVPPKANPATAGFRASAAIRLIVLQAAPRLWAKANERAGDTRERHTRFHELLVWFLKKHGFDVSSPFRQSYYDQGRAIQGRLDLLAARTSDSARLAVEVAFRPTSASAYKLLSARRDGAATLLICGFANTPAQAHESLSQACGRSTEGWFTVVCLPTVER